MQVTGEREQVTGVRSQLTGKPGVARVLAASLLSLLLLGGRGMAQQQAIVLKGGKLLTVSHGVIDDGVLSSINDGDFRGVRDVKARRFGVNG